MKIFSLFLPFFCFSAQVCTFYPPKDWQPAQPKELSEHVKIGFVGTSSTDFAPSINLATEEVDCNLSEYVKAVKEIHQAQPGTNWRDLGKIETKAGTGRLTEIVTSSPFGTLYMLQTLFVSNNTAYIMTGALLKEDFIEKKGELLASFRSLELADSLSDAIHNSALKTKVDSYFASLGDKKSERAEQWQQLQKFIEKETSEMGKYWQFLALKEGYEKIYPSKEGNQ